MLQRTWHYLFSHVIIVMIERRPLPHRRDDVLARDLDAQLAVARMELVPVPACIPIVVLRGAEIHHARLFGNDLSRMARSARKRAELLRSVHILGILCRTIVVARGSVEDLSGEPCLGIILFFYSLRGPVVDFNGIRVLHRRDDFIIELFADRGAMMGLFDKLICKMALSLCLQVDQRAVLASGEIIVTVHHE